jgi:hypothetical protein
MADNSVKVLTYTGHYFKDYVAIPGQARLIELLGKDSSDSLLDPQTISDFQTLCTMYEEYLYVAIQRAIDRVTREPRKFRGKRFVRVALDLNDEGSRDPSGELNLAFHNAHYGLQRPDADGAVTWTRRRRDTWRACGIRVHPFKAVQAVLKDLGYYLVDMSFVGIATDIRLYFKGPPSPDDYVANFRRVNAAITKDEIDFKYWFWHDLHHVV